MPNVILKGMKTVWVTDKPWSSPDGKVTIWLIKLEDPQGERGDYNTMSRKIATLDWSGDIELYTNDKGKEYVRQAPKEEAPQADKPTEEYWAAKQNQIKAQWAIGQAVGHYTAAQGELDYDHVEEMAKELFSMVDRVANPEEIDPNDRDIINLSDVPL